MQYRSLLTGACLALALNACQPSAPTSPATPTPADAPADAAAAPAASAAAPPAVAVRDPVAFAGEFTGTAPCADCPGIDITLSLKPDGAYQLKGVYQGDPGDPMLSQGNWRLDEEGLRLKLVPKDPSESSQWFGIVSPTEVRLFDQDGKAFDGPMAYSLKRAAQ